MRGRLGLDRARGTALNGRHGWWANRETWWLVFYVAGGAFLGMVVGMGCDSMPGIPEPLSLTVRLLVTTAVWTGPNIVQAQASEWRIACGSQVCGEGSPIITD